MFSIKVRRVLAASQQNDKITIRHRSHLYGNLLLCVNFFVWVSLKCDGVKAVYTAT